MTSSPTQLVSYIAPAAPATRRPATGCEPFLRPEIGFTPQWFCQSLDIDFSETWHTNPAVRAETIQAMRSSNLMNPSQRLYTAMDGRKPDRTPTLPKIWFDLACRLQQREPEELLVDPSLAMRTVIEAAHAVHADVARLFHLPPRRVQPHNGRLYEFDAAGTPVGPLDMNGGWATHCQPSYCPDLAEPMHAAFLQFWHTDVPLVDSLADVQRIAVPPAAFYDQHFGSTQRDCIRDWSHRIALVGDCGPVSLSYYVLLRGLERAAMDLIDSPALVHAACEKAAAIAIEKGKFSIDAGLRVLRLNDSVANMSLISPVQWRIFVKPCFTAACSALHDYCPDVRLYCHICGNALPIFHDLLEAGVDCIGPLDPLGGFSPADARAAVGPGVALLGGVNTLSFVDHDPDQLRGEAIAAIEQAGADGAFILASGCALPRDSRRENLIALGQAADDCARQYPVAQGYQPAKKAP